MKNWQMGSGDGRTQGMRLHRRLTGVLRAAACAALLLAGGAEAGEPVVKSLLEMRHENVVIQKWDLSCGAAALATLLRYQHGEDVTEKEVAVALMKREEYIRNPQLVQSREGFSLLDLKRNADSRGYLGNGYGRLQLKDLVAKAPIIVPIHTNGYNHFVIFRGVRGDRVLLADPAWGNRTMRVDEFTEKWIDYPSLGHIGFTVQRRDDVPPPNQLAPQGQDFVMLR
ncbi:C39 family peptidase [Noviherbaspirillum massiliense]|uniref:C39 family peptidase n=1 Tax=Noviherbaspirillum massiliense TaxID=1465823 RepID=UPI001C54E311|nr:C39 family peptidase [Noviherbaspirillum massiliense]